MERLFEILETIYSENLEENSYYDEYEHDWYFKDDCALANEAVTLCNEYLITYNGQCNWLNIGKLRDAGYSVFAGERDSFGWLTGCVRKKDDKRIIVYG